jgi:hypothetical protein
VNVKKANGEKRIGSLIATAAAPAHQLLRVREGRIWKSRVVDGSAELMKKVSRCVVDDDWREVLGLLRTESTKRREAGLANKDNNADTKTTTKTMREELTLLQGACLQGSSVDMVALSLINGAWLDVTTPVAQRAPAGRGTRASGGYTPTPQAHNHQHNDTNKDNSFKCSPVATEQAAAKVESKAHCCCRNEVGGKGRLLFLD